MSASVATLLASTVVTTLVAFGVRTTLVSQFYSFRQGWRTFRFAFGLSLSLLRLVIVLVFGFVLLLFLFLWGSEIEFVFPSERLSVLLQVRHDGVVGVVQFERRSQ